MLSGLVLLDGGIGSICSWEESTWALVELNDSITIRDKVNASAISMYNKIKFLFIFINHI